MDGDKASFFSLSKVRKDIKMTRKPQFNIPGGRPKVSGVRNWKRT